MESDKTIQDEINEYRAQFEKSMASIAAYQEKAKDEMAELRALHAEIAAEQKETDKQLKRNAKQLGELNGNWGRFVESLVEGDLVGLLNKRGIEVHRSACRVEASFPLDDGTRRYKEFDIVVANGEEVVVVEVKTTLRPYDVKRFVGAMRDIARYLPEYSSRTVYGAMAYISCGSETHKYAERQGLYLIRATGDSASIVNTRRFRPVSFTTASSQPPQSHLRAVPTG